MVDKEEGDDDIVPADMEVDPEVKQLATPQIMLYFPQPILEEELEENDQSNQNANQNANPPSPGWNLVRRRNQNYFLAKGEDASAKLQSKGKAIMESGGSARLNTRKDALVKPGISFKNATQGRGTIIIGDDNKLSSSSGEEVVSLSTSDPSLVSILSFSSLPEIAKLYNYDPADIYSPSHALDFYYANFEPSNVQFENFSDARASGFAGEDQNMNEYEVRMINGRRALVFATEDSGKDSGSKKRTRDMADDQSMAEAAAIEEDSASSHKAHKP